MAEEDSIFISNSAGDDVIAPADQATDQATTFKYELNLVDPSDGSIYSDFQFLYFIRTPFIKQASYIIAQINLPIVLVTKLLDDISYNKFDTWDLIIYSVDETDGIQINEIYNKHVTILAMSLQEPMTFVQPTIVVKLLLVHPIVYALSTSTSFNKVLSNKTALEAITEFEKFQDDTYGKFDYHKVGINEKVNNFRYEQIFIPPTIDTLNVTKYIINSYKPFSSYSMYFYDDFYFDENSDKEVTCHFINFFNLPVQFPKFDIAKINLDFDRFTRRLGKTDFSDQFKTLDKTSASITYRMKDMVFEFQKELQSEVESLSSGKTDSVTFVNKTMQVSDSAVIKSNTFANSVKSTIIYSPDTSANAKERVLIAKEMMFQKLENLCFYETEKCLPDWMQFGNLYNMNTDEPDSYLHTPISIVNIFRRNSEKESNVYCYHMLKYVMLKITQENKIVSESAAVSKQSEPEPIQQQTPEPTPEPTPAPPITTAPPETPPKKKPLELYINLMADPKDPPRPPQKILFNQTVKKNVDSFKIRRDSGNGLIETVCVSENSTLDAIAASIKSELISDPYYKNVNVIINSTLNTIDYDNNDYR